MYLLLGLMYVFLVVFEALHGPAAQKEKAPQEIEGLTDHPQIEIEGCEPALYSATRYFQSTGLK